MKSVPRRSTVLAFLAVALTASTFVHAAPAAAYPPDTWWYGQLSVTDAQKVSTGKGVTVAVVDSGIKNSLGDLRGQVVGGVSFTGGNPYVDPPVGNKYNGHGTSIAAWIAGTGRGAGMVGIAPGARLLSVQDGNNGTGVSVDAETKGITWAVDHGAKIINLSSGAPAACPAATQAAVDYAVRHDVIVVAATGNKADDPVNSPANCVGAIAVGGLGFSDKFQAWSDSSSGPALDFVAPAAHAKSLLLDDTISGIGDGGTSMATALVSGTFALLRSKFPTESARQIVTRALYNVHNGLGGKVFAKRINDQLGYGEILPKYALTEATPAGAQNPIYDAIDSHLKGQSASASPSTSASGGSNAASDAPSSAASTSQAAAASSDSGGPSPALVAVLVVVVVLVVAAIIGVVVRARRRSSGPRPGGPVPPGNYGGY